MPHRKALEELARLEKEMADLLEKGRQIEAKMAELRPQIPGVIDSTAIIKEAEVSPPSSGAPTA